jgi:hypothetical protein
MRSESIRKVIHRGYIFGACQHPRISARCEIRAAATESVAVIPSVHSPHAGVLSIDERKPSVTEAVVAALLRSGSEVFDRRLIVGYEVHQTSSISENYLLQFYHAQIGAILSVHESSKRVTLYQLNIDS